MKEVFTKDALFLNSKSRIVKGVIKGTNYKGKRIIKKVKSKNQASKYSKEIRSKTGQMDENSI